MLRFFLPTVLVCAVVLSGPSSWVAAQVTNPQDTGNEATQDDPPPTNPPSNLDTLVVPPQGNTQSDLSDLPQMPEVEGQTVVVRERYAGWNQANIEADEPPGDSTLRAHWVLVDDTGKLAGSVTATEDVQVGNLPIYLLLNGRPVLTTRSDEHGNFTFHNVSPGTYSLIGFGDHAMFASAFNAIEYKESLDGKMPASIRVRAVENKSTINLDWIRYFAPKVEYRVYGRFDSGEGTEDPARLLGMEGLSLIPPESVAASTIQDHTVALTADNRLVGRAHLLDSMNGRPVDVRNLRAMLLENNDLVAATNVNNYGVFQFLDVPPGNYALVVAGADGMGCIGINVVEELFADEGTGPVDVALITSETVGWLNHLASETAYLRIVSRSQPGGANGCCECQGACTCGNGIDSLYPKRNRPFNRVFRFINDMFDEAFYGESNPNNSNQQNDGKYRPRAF